MLAGILGRQNKVEYNPGQRHHELVVGIMASDPVGGDFATRWAHAPDAKPAKIASKSAASVR
jgi:hypothetical protein